MTKGGKKNYGGQQEFYQAGVELLGAGGLRADAEILLLLLECLQGLELSHCHLILGEAGLFSLLEYFHFVQLCTFTVLDSTVTFQTTSLIAFPQPCIS